MTAAEILLERIHRDGEINGELVKVDQFLNHMVDPVLIHQLGDDIAARFADVPVAKILTAETSGIMLAQAVALKLKVPFIYAKKKRPITMPDYYAAASYSFTKQESTTLYVSKEVLQAEDNILFIDDFFAKGSTLKAIEEIITQAKANLLGAAVIINKSTRRDIESILTLDDLS
ncbi:xanthine phosphoribosyltransferase [Desulfuromusa kysingii]|uniref:Xanthine phosphoribosyltransferase n=1 Tax=Desulfuromusa kysingii TaxID=37625 RepID=A0A1H3XB58_9BACT|nr:xanthine phosphoribosyltransferase [Desulfuromusa kysingii]SDZ95852.1 xanthine phosphoribosyltransferase [Desulfuromusa kysingii]